MKLEFTKFEFDYFVENCGFTDTELKVFMYRRRGWDIASIATEMDYSERTIKRYICKISCKIMRVMATKAP